MKKEIEYQKIAYFVSYFGIILVLHIKFFKLIDLNVYRNIIDKYLK